MNHIVLYKENSNGVNKTLLCVEEAGNSSGKICISPSNNMDIGKESSNLNLDEITAIIIAVRFYLNTKRNGNGATNNDFHLVQHNGNGRSISPWLYSWLEEVTRNSDFHTYLPRRNSLYSNS